MLDLSQLATFDLSELRADLVVGSIDRGIHVVADIIRRGKLAVALHVSGQSFSQRVASSDQPRVKSKQSIFAGHITPPGVRRSGSMASRSTRMTRKFAPLPSFRMNLSGFKLKKKMDRAAHHTHKHFVRDTKVARFSV